LLPIYYPITLDFNAILTIRHYQSVSLGSTVLSMAPHAATHEPYDISPLSSQETLLGKFLLSKSSLSLLRTPPFKTINMEHHQDTTQHNVVLSDSDSCQEDDNDYGTDITTPPTSELGDDRDNEEVESFRDSEYPQMAQGVYLDHGGATVSLFILMPYHQACVADST